MKLICTLIILLISSFASGQESKRFMELDKMYSSYGPLLNKQIFYANTPKYIYLTKKKYYKQFFGLQNKLFLPLFDKTRYIHIKSLSIAIEKSSFRSKKIKITGVINKLDSLESLEISRPVFLDSIKPFKNLVRIYIDDADKYPYFIYGSYELEDVFIEQVHDMSNFDNRVGQLKKLRKILIYSDALTKIPDSIIHCVNLTNLDILFYSKQKVLKLPKGISNLQKLKGLCIPFDIAKNLEEISTMKHLETLCVYEYSSNNYKRLEKLSFLKSFKIEYVSTELVLEFKEAVKLYLPDTKITINGDFVN